MWLYSVQLFPRTVTKQYWNEAFLSAAAIAASEAGSASDDEKYYFLLLLEYGTKEFSATVEHLLPNWIGAVFQNLTFPKSSEMRRVATRILEDYADTLLIAEKALVPHAELEASLDSLLRMLRIHVEYSFARIWVCIVIAGKFSLSNQNWRNRVFEAAYTLKFGRSAETTWLTVFAIEAFVRNPDPASNLDSIDVVMKIQKVLTTSFDNGLSIFPVWAYFICALNHRLRFSKIWNIVITPFLQYKYMSKAEAGYFLDLFNEKSTLQACDEVFARERMQHLNSESVVRCVVQLPLSLFCGKLGGILECKEVFKLLRLKRRQESTSSWISELLLRSLKSKPARMALLETLQNKQTAQRLLISLNYDMVSLFLLAKDERSELASFNFKMWCLLADQLVQECTGVESQQVSNKSPPLTAIVKILTIPFDERFRLAQLHNEKSHSIVLWNELIRTTTTNNHPDSARNLIFHFLDATYACVSQWQRESLGHHQNSFLLQAITQVVNSVDPTFTKYDEKSGTQEYLLSKCAMITRKAVHYFQDSREDYALKYFHIFLLIMERVKLHNDAVQITVILEDFLGEREPQYSSATSVIQSTIINAVLKMLQSLPGANWTQQHSRRLESFIRKAHSVKGTSQSNSGILPALEFLRKTFSTYDVKRTFSPPTQQVFTSPCNPGSYGRESNTGIRSSASTLVLSPSSAGSYRREGYAGIDATYASPLNSQSTQVDDDALSIETQT